MNSFYSRQLFVHHAKSIVPAAMIVRACSFSSKNICSISLSSLRLERMNSSLDKIRPVCCPEHPRQFHFIYSLSIHIINICSHFITEFCEVRKSEGILFLLL